MQLKLTHKHDNLIECRITQIAVGIKIGCNVFDLIV